MDTKGFVVPPGGGSILSMAPGRSAALKLLGGDTGDSIMLFEETAPAGTGAAPPVNLQQRKCLWTGRHSRSVPIADIWRASPHHHGRTLAIMEPG